MGYDVCKLQLQMLFQPHVTVALKLRTTHNLHAQARQLGKQGWPGVSAMAGTTVPQLASIQRETWSGRDVQERTRHSGLVSAPSCGTGRTRSPCVCVTAHAGRMISRLSQPRCLNHLLSHSSAPAPGM